MLSAFEFHHFICVMPDAAALNMAKMSLGFQLLVFAS